MRRAVALIVLGAASCHGGSGQQISVQSKLDQIADKCGVARSTFKLVGADDLHIQPSPDADYANVDCALTELKKANLPVKMGFVGNEYYAGNEQ